jgi:hypothetical protein
MPVVVDNVFVCAVVGEDGAHDAVNEQAAAGDGIGVHVWGLSALLNSKASEKAGVTHSIHPRFLSPAFLPLSGLGWRGLFNADDCWPIRAGDISAHSFLLPHNNVSHGN